MGRGGSGTLASVQPTGRPTNHSWVLNRITELKRGVTIRARGYQVPKSASGVTPEVTSIWGEPIKSIRLSETCGYTQ